MKPGDSTRRFPKSLLALTAWLGLHVLTARALPDGRWVKLAGAGHTVQGDNPAGLLVSLREFLSKVTEGARRV